MNWFYVEKGQQAGPVSEEQLDEKFRQGIIQPDTLVWREGMAAWTPYQEAKRGATVARAETEPKPEAVCAECGGVFSVQDTISYGGVRVCARCKPIFMQKLAEGAKLHTGALTYAGFWTRFAAVFLDGILLGTSTGSFNSYPPSP